MFTRMPDPVSEYAAPAGRILFIVLFFGLVGSGTVSAQDAPEPPSPPPGPPDVEWRLERMMQDMTEEIELSGEQQEQIREILAARMEKQREMFESRRAEERRSRQEMRAEMMKLRDQSDAEVKALLNDEQAAAYDEFVKERRERRRGPGRRMRGPMR